MSSPFGCGEDSGPNSARRGWRVVLTNIDQTVRPSGARRTAAAIALLAVVSVIAVAVTAFLRDPLRLTAALLFIAVVVMAGWWAIVRRGVWRTVGSALAVVALLVLVLVIAAGSLPRMAVFVALLALSMSSARVAIGRDLAETPADLHAVGRAKNGVLLMNPKSGGGK